MIDISTQLREIMTKNNCSSLCAFMIIRGEKDGIHIHESKSFQEADGRLCDKSNKSCEWKRLGGNLH